jgi:N-formylglutamate deformylase
MSAYYRTLAGSPHSPVILHVPHGSRHVPGPVRSRILLDDAELAAELDRMTDADTGVIAAHAAVAAARTPWTFENLTSRLVVDPERFPDEREEMRAVGMGAVYSRTSHGSPLRHTAGDPGTDTGAHSGAADAAEHEQDLLNTYFHPYAHAMTELVDDRLAATGRAVVIDVHSYPSAPLPYELHADGARPPLCLGTDPFHTPDWLLAPARAAFGDVLGSDRIELDTPFSGCYVPLKHYGAVPEVSALMLEFRRDGYLTEPAGPSTPGLDRLAAALARVVDVVDDRCDRLPS